MVHGTYDINLDEMINSIPEGKERDRACQWLVDVLDLPPEVAWSSNKIVSELQSFINAPAFKGWDPQQVILANFNKTKWLSSGFSSSEIDKAVGIVLDYHNRSSNWSTLRDASSYEQLLSSIGSFELNPVGDGVTWRVLTKDGDLVVNHRVILSNGFYKFQVNKED